MQRLVKQKYLWEQQVNQLALMKKIFAFLRNNEVILERFLEKPLFRRRTHTSSNPQGVEPPPPSKPVTAGRIYLNK
jgi:hypothetical protein